MNRSVGLLINQLLFLVVCGGLLFQSIKNNQNHLIYSLDDTYIHMALAKNLALDGKWELSEGHGLSASSSPLYSLMLATAYYLFGVSEYSPLILNILAGLFTLSWVYFYFKRSGWGDKWAGSLTGIFWITTTLPVLLLSGMEHGWQVWINCLFIAVLSANISLNHPEQDFKLAFLAMLVMGIRYEGVFLIALAVILCIWLRRFPLALWVGCWGLFPLLVFGAFSFFSGGSFLPISILNKSKLPFFSSSTAENWAMQIVDNLYYHPYLLIILVVLLFLLGKQKHFSFTSLASLWLIMGAGLCLLHALFALAAFRYDTYVVAVAVIALPIYLKEDGVNLPFKPFNAQKIFLMGLSGGLIFPFIVRTGFFFSNHLIFTENIYQQPYQVGIFLASYYQDKEVAVNDVGAVAYFTDSRITDLFGTTDLEVFRAKKEGRLSSSWADSLLDRRSCKLAVIHENWVGHLIPASWEKVGSWTIPNNRICADETISWFAKDLATARRLRKELQQFSANLPPEVMVRYVQF